MEKISNKMNLKVKIILFALAISTFTIGTTEFVIVGLLPNIAADLSVSLISVGTVVSWYAITIAVGTPIITILINKYSRRNTLVVLLLLFSISSICTAYVDSYEFLLFVRILTALTHGVYFALSIPVAADLVPREKKGFAISLMFLGLTISTIVGVPMGTFLGQQLGWRSVFLVVGILGIISLVCIFLTLKNIPSKKTTGIKSNIKLLKNKRVLFALIMTTFGFGATFSVFTYLTPILENISGYSSESIVILLFIYGIAVSIGNLLGGKVSGSHPVRILRYILFLQSMVILIQMVLLPNAYLSIISVFLLGLFAFMLTPPAQAYIIALSDIFEPGSEGVASALTISAMNIGIALGAFVGGKAISHYGWTSTILVGVLMGIIATVMAIVNYQLDKRDNYF